MSEQLAVSPSYPITQFVDDDAIATLATRIVTLLPRMLPQSEQLTEAESIALAQVALLHNLSPFNGEIWYLKGNGRSLGVMPGIKGYRKHAHAALRKIDRAASYSLDYRIASPNEAEAPEGSVVVQATLRVSIDTDAYLRSQQLAYAAFKGLSDVPFAVMKADVVDIIGPPPVYQAFGVIRPDEFKRFEAARLNKMAQAHVRAERGVLRQRFDLEMGAAAYREDAELATASADWLDAQFLNAEEEEYARDTAERAAQMSDETKSAIDRALGVEPRPRKN